MVKVMEQQKLTYVIEPSDKVSFTITCLVCGMKSYNQNDVEQKYCGNCHQFHDIMMAMKEMEQKKK